jgi:hypothetical protein
MHPGDTFVEHAKAGRRRFGHVDDAAGHEWSPVVDPHDDGVVFSALVTCTHACMGRTGCAAVSA